MILYVVYGRFSEDEPISGKTYRTRGMPAGVEMRKLSRAERADFPFTDGVFAEAVGKTKPGLLRQVQTVPECLVVQGEVADPPDLKYLRDVVGIVTFALDHGGVAVIDPQQIKLYEPARWKEEIFEPQPPRLSKHAVILLSDEPDGTRWFHTRGMRKFGRPDLSMHRVPRDLEKGVIEMMNRFILSQAQGARIPDGEEIRMASLPSGLTCHHAGSLEDPDFNNVHVEIQWPPAH